MEKASKHCMRARIAICHDQIKSAKNVIQSKRQQLSQQVTNDTFTTLSRFLEGRARSVQNNINNRHASKLESLRKEQDNSYTIDKSTGLSTYLPNHSPRLNARSSKRAQNLLGHQPLYHTKTLLPKSKLPLHTCQTNQKTPYAPLLPVY